jgi:hypothetical protein
MAARCFVLIVAKRHLCAHLRHQWRRRVWHKDVDGVKGLLMVREIWQCLKRKLHRNGPGQGTSGEWLESFVNAWQETAVEIKHAQKFLHLFDISGCSRECENWLVMWSERCYAGGGDTIAKEFNLRLCKLAFGRNDV